MFDHFPPSCSASLPEGRAGALACSRWIAGASRQVSTPAQTFPRLQADNSFLCWDRPSACAGAKESLLLYFTSNPGGAEARKNLTGQRGAAGESAGPRKNASSENYFIFHFPTRQTNPAASSYGSKTTAGGLLRAFEDANLPERNILEIVFKYLTNSSEYYKVKTHTNSSPFHGLNMLIFFVK
jgi:hypothetical protein